MVTKTCLAGTDSRIRALMWAGAWHPPTRSWVPAGRAFGACGYVTGGDPLLPSQRGSLFQTSSRNIATFKLDYDRAVRNSDGVSLTVPVYRSFVWVLLAVFLRRIRRRFSLSGGTLSLTSQ